MYKNEMSILVLWYLMMHNDCTVYSDLNETPLKTLKTNTWAHPFFLFTHKRRLALTFLWVIWVHYSCCSIDWTKAINSFQIQLPVWRGAVEHEHQHLRRFSPNTFFLRVPKETCYYFQPFASGDFFLFWGERALSPHRHRATKTPHEAKVENVSMVPAQGHLDNNIKLGLLGLNLLWHLHLPVPFCH